MPAFLTYVCNSGMGCHLASMVSNTPPLYTVIMNPNNAITETRKDQEITQREAAEMLKISTGRVHQLIKSGRIEKLNDRISKDSVNRLIEERRMKAKSTNNPQEITQREAAEMLKISTGRVQQLIKSGRIEKLNDRVSKDSVNRLIEERLMEAEGVSRYAMWAMEHPWANKWDKKTLEYAVLEALALTPDISQVSAKLHINSITVTDIVRWCQWAEKEN